MDDARPPVGSRLPLFAILFFVSGATGLVYEVLWTRRLTLVFGHSVLAASTVLAAYMGGLGLGSLAGGRWADQAPQRFWRRYAGLEAGIAVSALLTLPLLHLVQQAYLALAGAGMEGLALQGVCLVLATVVLFPPTLMMGATLPVLARGLAGGLPEGRLVGLLYGLNTAGACLGAALAGYWMLPALGLRISLAAAALVNLFLAALAWRASQGLLPVPDRETGEPSPPHGDWLIPIAVAVAGAAAMIFEVGWTRGLVLCLGSSTYALATILTVFLAGLGGGGLLYSLLPAGSPRPGTLGSLQLAAGLWGALASYLLGLAPYLVLVLTRKVGGPGAALLMQNVVAALILAGPAVLLGLAFPLAVELYQGRALGGRLARLYGANTAGCVLGAVLAGLWLVPSVGVQGTLKLAALSLVGMSLVIAAATGERLGERLPALIFGSLAGFLVLALPAWNPALMTAGLSLYASAFNGSLSELRGLPDPTWYRDGESATISVHAVHDGGLSMRTNGKADASTSLLDMSTQYLLGYIPALYGKPRTVAVIGLGSGMTIQALAQVPGVERIDCAELEPAVVEAFAWWQGYNGHVGRDPRVHIRTADGRTFLETSREHYDLIVSEPSNVWVAGVGNLYTREFYAACLRRLSERGIMAQWFQNYAVGSEEVGMVINTFFDVFPHGALWATSVRENDVLLIGCRQQALLQGAWLRQVTAVPAIRQRLLSLGLASSEAILGHYLCTREAALAYFGRSRLNTDDRPALEFLAARRLYGSTRRVEFSRLLSDPAHPLPEGLTPTPELLQAAVEGWMSSRDTSELGRLLQLHEAQLAGSPLVLALVAALQRGITSEALVLAFRPAVEAPTTRNLATYLLALQLQSHADWQRAADWYEKASQAPPPGAQAQLWVNLGSCYAQLNQLEKALVCYRRGVAEGAGYACLTLLGDVEMRAGRPVEAMRWYQRAAAENQAFVPALWGQGRAWVARKQYRQAAAAFREVIALTANHIQALMGLGWCESRLGDAPAARRAYEQVLRFDPNNREALSKLYELDTGAPTR